MAKLAHEGPMDAACLAALPAVPGAYRLWLGGRIVYVGMAALSLRGEVRRHWRGEFGERTQGATHFECWAAESPEHAHELYLALYLDSGLPPTQTGSRALCRSV